MENRLIFRKRFGEIPENFNLFKCFAVLYNVQ